MNLKNGLLLTFSLILSMCVGFGYDKLHQEENEAVKQHEKSAVSGNTVQETQETREPSNQTPDLFPPIDNMHHFMEYVMEPSYKSLKTALATEPSERSEWRKIKAYVLTLAETCALVAQRPPADATKEQIRQWREISWQVRKAGSDLYSSIGDFEKSRKNYELMLDHCNRCHTTFEEGRHQLDK